MFNSNDTIQRCPHDEENPYTQVLNALIRDKSISPNCRMIIIFLLSNKNNWTIRIPQLCAEFKEHLGRDLIYKLINEAIEAGYIYREWFIKNGLQRCRYYLSEKPKFKKCLPHPCFQDPGAQDPENQHAKERTSKERTSIKKEYKQQQQRESEPPKHLEKFKQPEPLPNAAADQKISSESIEYQTPGGKKKSISETEIYQYFISRSYKTSTIQEAIRRIKEKKEPIGDPLKLLEVICKSIEEKSANALHSKPKILEYKCNIPKSMAPASKKLKFVNPWEKDKK